MSHACFLQFVQRQTLHNMMAVVSLRQCTPTDAAQICDIHNYHVREFKFGDWIDVAYWELML